MYRVTITGTRGRRATEMKFEVEGIDLKKTKQRAIQQASRHGYHIKRITVDQFEENEKALETSSESKQINSLEELEQLVAQA